MRKSITVEVVPKEELPIGRGAVVGSFSGQLVRVAVAVPVLVARVVLLQAAARVVLAQVEQLAGAVPRVAMLEVRVAP